MLGTGTREDPYIIMTVDDLQNMANDLDAYYELGGDIDASATSGWNEGAGFAPIGSQATPFTGQLDGKGYTIKGLFINLPAAEQVGMFGWAEGFTVQNMTLADFNITGGAWGTNHGVGTLAGYCQNPILTNIHVTNPTVDGGDTMYIGGLCGVIYVYSTTGIVEGVPYTHGATVTSCDVVITANMVGGEYKGGLLGGFFFSDFDNEISDCHVSGTGAITSTDSLVGGLIGWVENGYAAG